jgi:hypothetical protein
MIPVFYCIGFDTIRTCVHPINSPRRDLWGHGHYHFLIFNLFYKLIIYLDLGLNYIYFALSQKKKKTNELLKLKKKKNKIVNLIYHILEIAFKF